jgi:hypothetical protein
MQHSMQMRALARKILATPVTLLALTLLLLSPASALAGHKSDWERPWDGKHEDRDGKHEDRDGRGCVSSPENPSVLLMLLGGVGAFVIPVLRQRLARKAGSRL